MINVEKEIGGKVLSLQTGKIARQSAGSVVLTYGETVLLIAVNAAKEAREDIDSQLEKYQVVFLKEKLDQLKGRC